MDESKKQNTEKENHRVELIQAAELKVIHANAFHTNFNKDEIFLTLCVARPGQDEIGSKIVVYPQEAVGMTLLSARRMIEALEKVLVHHKEQYGEKDD